MPRIPNRTVAVAVNHISPDDDEDNDICPVCDGDCTCNNGPHPLPPNVSHGNARFVATPTASTASSAPALRAQPLKIKLIVPPSIQNKARGLGSAPKNSRSEDSPAASNGVAGSSSVSSHLASAIAGHGQHSSSDPIGPKRRRRASMAAAIAIARDGATNALSDRKIRGNAVNTLPQSQSNLSSHTYAQRPVTSRATRPQVQTSKSNLAASRHTSKSQAKGTIANRLDSIKKKQKSLGDLADSHLQPSVVDDDGDDVSSGRFPTFVSADGLASEASDSSDSESDSDASGFGSDLSLAAEEENLLSRSEGVTTRPAFVESCWETTFRSSKN
ncbi:hypothetical protein JVT61DRAFT_106 [Boletus reticuloceps]|uniref:Uncharacterized protein n=1 Tax=Boletus reticuloceps TaxID=495285 RepID=A0A8I2YZY0_9AGAM|nr:hypothetical protein JVT61DRAFT_106 [Boletus reticuloceps]